jgi:hypothetical protein
MIRRPTLPLTALLLLAASTVAPLPARAADEAIPVEVQHAVDNGLDWLSRTQSRDGSWSSTGPSAAATGLATMAFMARGNVPGQGPYGDNINHGIDAILGKQSKEGVFGQGSNSVMYEHGICTVALCETYGMLDDKRQTLCRAAIAKAVRVILDAQRVLKNPSDQGGWRYTPDTNQSDISVSGWQLMALRGASNAGANIPQKALDDGINYIKRRAVLGGGFSYTGNGSPNAARTGTGVLALTLMGQPDAPEVKAGGDYLLRTRVGNGDGHYFYTVYYCSQAAWQLGDKYWSILNADISASIRAKQKADGSWDGGSESSNYYATAMAILALTVPYRYLPIYQR